jgi:hypothetical protein
MRISDSLGTVLHRLLPRAVGSSGSAVFKMSYFVPFCCRVIVDKQPKITVNL